MSVKVFIRRSIDKDKIPVLYDLLRELRALTLGQPGYISGETLYRIDAENEAVVVSSWQSMENWKNWFESRERSEIQAKIDALLNTPTTYEVYRY